jgi:hypothetical protein
MRGRVGVGCLLLGMVACAVPALAQRSAAPEVSRPNRSCTDIYQMCLKRQGQANCEGFRQECIRTGTWQSPIETTRDLQRR